MCWYNPKTKSTKERSTPKTDKEALSLLDCDLDSEAFVMEYEKQRGHGHRASLSIHWPRVSVEGAALPATRLNSIRLGLSAALALLFALIHPSAWKVNSANFAMTEFQEVRLN